MEFKKKISAYMQKCLELIGGDDKKLCVGEVEDGQFFECFLVFTTQNHCH